MYSKFWAPEDREEPLRSYDKALSSPGLQKSSNKSSNLNASKGYTYVSLGKLSEAENSFKLAKDIAFFLGDKEKTANNYLALANLYANHLNRFEEALNSAQKVIGLSGDQIKKTTALHISSSPSLSMGRYRDALKYDIDAADHYKQSNSPKEEVFALSQVAAVLSLMGKHEEAMEHLERILELYESLNDKGQMIEILCSIAQEDINLGAYENALYRTKRALEIAGRAKEPDTRSQMP